MPVARTHSIALVGVEGHPVEIEVDIENGLPGLLLVGLPDTALREARDRIRAAIINSGEHWPQHRVTVGLSPASLPKRGSGFDVSNRRLAVSREPHHEDPRRRPELVELVARPRIGSQPPGSHHRTPPRRQEAAVVSAVTGLPDSIGAGETPRQRMNRLAHSMLVFLATAEDAQQEADRAKQRAHEATLRLDTAIQEYRLAEYACEISEATS
jgi:Mg-chelatase subunit ChlI-like protein